MAGGACTGVFLSAGSSALALSEFLPQLCLLSNLRTGHLSVTLLLAGWLLDLPSLGDI